MDVTVLNIVTNILVIGVDIALVIFGGKMFFDTKSNKREIKKLKEDLEQWTRKKNC